MKTLLDCIEEETFFGFMPLLIPSSGWTPLFEFCTVENRVVIEYPTDLLLLLSIRHNRSGAYLTWSIVKQLVRRLI